MKPMDPHHLPQPDDDWLDRALQRQARAEPAWLADDGFSERVMGGLPRARRRAWSSWLPLAGAVLGIALLLLLAPYRADFASVLAQIRQPGGATTTLLLLAPLLLTCATLLLLLSAERD